jgi:hypothetical protein
MSVIQLVQLLDESQGFSQLHGHQPWHMSKVALTLHSNVFQMRLQPFHLTNSSKSKLSYRLWIGGRSAQFKVFSVTHPNLRCMLGYTY